MCIIFYNENGQRYDHKMLSIAYDNNPHGMGIMWVEKGRMQVQTLKGLFTKHRMFEILKHFEGVPHAMHLRWRTRGKINKEMCHPFRASHDGAEEVYMMHNGTFSNIETKSDESDSLAFAKCMQKITRDYGTDILFTESFLRRVEKDIKSWNKVIFLRGDGKVSIMNPSEWHVVDGLWMSNTYSLLEGYRKAGLMSSVANKITIRSTGRPETVQDSGKTDWLALSEKWEKTRVLKWKLVADNEEETRTTTDAKKSKLSKKERKRAQREACRLECELPTLKTSGRVIRRRRRADGTIEETDITPH